MPGETSGRDIIEQARKIHLVTRRAPLRAHSLLGMALTQLISLSQPRDLETGKLSLTGVILQPPAETGLGQDLTPHPCDLKPGLSWLHQLPGV